MRKLGKKRNDIKHTIEAYSCYCNCWVNCFCDCYTADLQSGITNSRHTSTVNSRQTMISSAASA